MPKYPQCAKPMLLETHVTVFNTLNIATFFLLYVLHKVPQSKDTVDTKSLKHYSIVLKHTDKRYNT